VQHGVAAGDEAVGREDDVAVLAAEEVVAVFERKRAAAHAALEQRDEPEAVARIG
jgi:hypothetical protein